MTLRFRLADALRRLADRIDDGQPTVAYHRRLEALDFRLERVEARLGGAPLDGPSGYYCSDLADHKLDPCWLIALAERVDKAHGQLAGLWSIFPLASWRGGYGLALQMGLV